MGVSMEKRLLITCFEPFAGRSSNTSMRLLGPLLASPPSGVLTRVLPVDFQALRRMVPRLIRTIRPRVWLMLGEEASGEKMRCERVAVNLVGGSVPDNKGVLGGGKVVRGGPAAYFTTLDPGRMVRHFASRSVPARLSDDAGTYACNLALYLALHHCRRHGEQTEVGFVHVPRTYRKTGQSLSELRSAVIDLAQMLLADAHEAA